MHALVLPLPWGNIRRIFCLPWGNIRRIFASRGGILDVFSAFPAGEDIKRIFGFSRGGILNAFLPPVGGILDVFLPPVGEY